MRIKYLDGLKGLGAVMVFLSHYCLMNFSAPAWFKEGYVSSLFFSGGLAVGLFLIISGFSAWLSVARKLNNDEKISRLVVNRYLRFAVPFGIVFTILYATYFTGVYSWHIEAGALTGSKVLQTVFWPVNIVGFAKSVILSPVNPDFWDAPLWMMKYVFLGTYIALIVRLGINSMDRKRQLVILLFCTVIMTLWDIFYMGVMIGLILAFLYGINRRKYPQMGGVIFLCLFLLMRYKMPLPISIEAKNFLSAIVLILSVYMLPVFQQLFETHLMQYLGKISFSMFIWHWPILCSLTSFLCVKTQFIPFEMAFAIQFGLTTIAVVLVSHLSQKYIESVFSARLIHYIDSKLFGKEEYAVSGNR